MPRNFASIAIIGALFFVFGFVTWLNGPLISFVQLAFELSVFKAFLVTFVFYLSYFFFALPASAWGCGCAGGWCSPRFLRGPPRQTSHPILSQGDRTLGRARPKSVAGGAGDAAEPAGGHEQSVLFLLHRFALAA